MKILSTPFSDVTIRPAQEADAPAYRALRLEALRKHPTAFSADLALSENRPLTYWAERIRALGSNGMLYFALYAETLIGICGIYRGDAPKTRHSATIVSVYVQPVWRGQHIATSLIAACLDWARTQEITVVKLAVVSNQSAAIRCYARCGFTVYGLEPQALCVDGIFYDELLMVQRL